MSVTYKPGSFVKVARITRAYSDPKTALSDAGFLDRGECLLVLKPEKTYGYSFGATKFVFCLTRLGLVYVPRYNLIRVYGTGKALE